MGLCTNVALATGAMLQRVPDDKESSFCANGGEATGLFIVASNCWKNMFPMAEHSFCAKRGEATGLFMPEHSFCSTGGETIVIICCVKSLEKDVSLMQHTCSLMQDAVGALQSRRRERMAFA